MNDDTSRKTKVHVLRYREDGTRASRPSTGMTPAMILVGADPRTMTHCVNTVTEDGTLDFVRRRTPWELTFLYETASVVHGIVEDSRQHVYGTRSMDMRLWKIERIAGGRAKAKQLVAVLATNAALKGCLEHLCREGPEFSVEYVATRTTVGKLPFVRGIADLLDDGPPVEVVS